MKSGLWDPAMHQKQLTVCTVRQGTKVASVESVMLATMISQKEVTPKQQLPMERSSLNATAVDPLTKYVNVQQIETRVSSVMAAIISRHSANQRMYMKSRHMKKKNMSSYTLCSSI